MRFHYDTCYYKAGRSTLLVGFKGGSSSRLLCHVHTKNRGDQVRSSS